MVEDILKERGSRYGEYENQARLSQSLKYAVDRHIKEWGQASSYEPFMSESLEMILHKIARIANGDPTYIESWRDIAGYAELVVKELGKIDGSVDGVVRTIKRVNGEWVDISK